MMRASKQILLFLFIVFSGFSIPVSGQRKCGFDKAIRDAVSRNPELLLRLEKIEKGLSLPPSVPKSLRMDSISGIVTIPVVVHIVLPDPNAVTDSQVYSQITVLDSDYTVSDPDTSLVPGVWKPIIGNMKLEFCLAQRTPDGRPSNGIDRVVTNQTTFSVNNAASDVKHISTGGADSWGDQDYLNIWVCELSSGYLGVTTLPGLYPDDEQGVVIEYHAFGTIGALDPTYNLGRTTTHEIGHYFNLLHPWGIGTGSCSPGDYVGDTPPQSGPVYGCPSFPYTDVCSPNPPGILLSDFMGYVDDDCMHMFTQGQVTRAMASLFTDRVSLLSSPACNPVILKRIDAEILRVVQPSGKICDGSLQPLVTLRNYGLDTLKSVQIVYYTDSSNPKTFNWTGQLSTFDSVRVPLPSFVVGVGSYQLTVFTQGPNDSTDQQPANDTGISVFHLDPVLSGTLTEGFEESAFPPPYWEVINPDNSYTWQRTALASHSGTYSVVMRNLAYQNNGAIDDLVSPVIDEQASDSAFLFFDVAAAVQSDPYGSNQYWDTLEVLISQDCGQTATILYKHWGINLITDSVPTPTEFFPGPGQWRRDSINLSSYIHQGDFQLIFRNISNFENDIYLDDIDIIPRPINPQLKASKVLIVPNPTSGDLLIEFLKITPDLREVQLFNDIGQLIGDLPASSAVNNRITFHLANQPNGVYFVRILYQDHQIVRKIIKVP